MEINRSGEMEVFVAVVQAGSFSEAARKLKLTPSAVAKLIARIELRLSVRLMNRTTRTLVLTPEGQGFFDNARRLLADLDEIENQVSASASTLKGLLRINASIPLGNLLLIPLLPKFLEKYPEVSVDLNLTENVVDILQERTDIAIRHGTLKDSGLIARKLGRSRQVLTASPTYLDRYGVPQRPEDLRQHNCMDFNFTRSLSQWNFLVDGVKRPIAVSGNFVASNGYTLQRLGLAGMGITRLSMFQVADDIEQGRLIPLLEEFSAHEADDINAVYSTRHHVSPRIHAFIDFLAESITGDLKLRTSC
ncbi:MAG: LysR family transcriptional regulator [Pseudomonadota bacterium]